VAELKGQIASLLTRYPNGILLSGLRDLFRENFSHEIDEREYGDFTGIEELISGALSDVVRMEVIPQTSDLMIHPVLPAPSSTQNDQDTPTSTQEKTNDKTSKELPVPEKEESIDDGHQIDASKQQERVIKPTSLLFDDSEREGRPPTKIPMVKATLKVKPKNTEKHNPPKPVSLVADYD